MAKTHKKIVDKKVKENSKIADSKLLDKKLVDSKLDSIVTTSPIVPVKLAEPMQERKEERKRECKEKIFFPREKIKGKVIGERIILESSDGARDLYAQSRYGTVISGGRVQLSMLEALYLVDKQRITIVDGRGRILSLDNLIALGKKNFKDLYTKYCVFKDLRTRGYIVKSALKFGADLRVYDRGVKPGDDHAKWIVYPVHETHNMTWYDFAAKNRVAHSTKKRLLIGIVDDEAEITYFEIRWERP